MERCCIWPENPTDENRKNCSRSKGRSLKKNGPWKTGGVELSGAHRSHHGVHGSRSKKPKDGGTKPKRPGYPRHCKGWGRRRVNELPERVAR